MKLVDAYVAWCPAQLGAEYTRTGDVVVGTMAQIEPMLDAPIYQRLPMWIGAARLEGPAGESDTHRLLAMFVNFNTLVVRDGLEVQRVHDAFLAIDEYRETISSDTRGAD